MNLTSPVFQEGQPVPTKYTCDGVDISPPLHWTEPPPGTKSFALVCEDPDAPMGTWVHWVVYGLPAEARSLAEKQPTGDLLSGGGRQGMTDFRRTGYGGPCPPPGKLHRYFFKLYALDAELTLPPRLDRKGLRAAIHDHVLGEASLMGTYQRCR